MAGQKERGAIMKKHQVMKRCVRLERNIMDLLIFNPIAKNIFSSTFFRFLLNEIEKFKEKNLLADVKKSTVPHHIAIIMDGNRRFAREMKIDMLKGHQLGADRMEEIVDLCRELGTKVITVYAFSTENFRRPEKEVTELMDLIFEKLNGMLTDQRIHKYKIKINVIGNLDLLPENVQEMAKKVMNATKSYDAYIFNIAIAYGGRDEIVEATRKIMKKVQTGKIEPENIDNETLSSHLYTAGLPDPDIIIRTSGEERISNFLLWQMANALFYFYDIYWPSFRRIDLLKIIKMYQVRERNGV